MTTVHSKEQYGLCPKCGQVQHLIWKDETWVVDKHYQDEPIMSGCLGFASVCDGAGEAPSRIGAKSEQDARASRRR